LSQKRLGRLAHASGDLIGKIEKGERRPAPDLIDRLDTLLETGEELNRIGSDLPPPAGESHRRRSDASESHVPRPVTFDGSPTPEILAGLRDVLAGCRKLDHSLGPEAVRPTMLTQVTLAEALLAGCHDRQQRDLLTILAELHQFIGWLAFDRTQIPPARTAFATAARYAEATDDPALMAYILGPSHGFAATYSGHPQDGVALGTAALDWARRAANPRLTAFVQATSARGHARLGDNHTCLKLLEAAERELEGVDPDEPVPLWLRVFDRAALEGHRGSCLLDLTRPTQAITALTAQDTTAPRCFARNRTIWLLDCTRAYLNLGDVDAACHTLGQALPLARTTSSRRVDTRIRQAAVTLMPHRVYPAVGEILNQMTGPAR
jgi:hypothetical protein